MAGTLESETMRSSRTHSAMPGASMRSISTHLAPDWAESTGPRICRFRIVSGRHTACVISGRLRPLYSAIAPGSSMLCWLCTQPLGRPVVPLV